MNARTIAISAVAGTIAMFAWQSVSQTVIPWHAATMQELSDTTARAIPAIRALAGSNGVYFSRYGVLMTVRIAPNNAPQTTTDMMVPMLGKQAAVDLLVVLAMCVFVGFLADRSPLGVAKAMSLAAFAIVGLQELANSIWYGFTYSWSIINVVDQTIGFFLTGLVIGSLMRRFDKDAAIALPEGQGYRTSGGRKTVAH